MGRCECTAWAGVTVQHGQDSMGRCLRTAWAGASVQHGQVRAYSMGMLIEGGDGGYLSVGVIGIIYQVTAVLTV